MRIGVGLPNTIPGTPGPRLVEWAQRAEEHGFSTLATIGRLVFPTYEDIQSLTAAAAVTKRIGLLTNTLIGGTYDPALLAKLAAGLDQVSGGRFVLGLAPGWRDEDYRVAGREWRARGRRLDETVESMQRAWRGEVPEGATKRLTPTPVNGRSVPMAFGGHAPAAIDRAARFGVGWTAGGASPDEVSGLIEQVRAAWQRAGRTGAPRLWALAYFGLGPDARDAATDYLTDYYGDWGPGMAQAMPADRQAVQRTVAAYEATGVDELILDPVSSGMEQLDMLAEALADRLAAQREDVALRAA